MIVVILVGAGWAVHLLTSETTTAKISDAGMTPVNVDDVVRNPEKFVGSPIGVAGTIIKVDETKSMLTLGCEDACIAMPVKIKAQPFQTGTNVIAYGEVKKTDQTKYIFIAEEIVAK